MLDSIMAERGKMWNSSATFEKYRIVQACLFQSDFGKYPRKSRSLSQRKIETENKIDL